MLRHSLIRSFHTSPVRAAGGFSRFNPWAKQSTVPPTPKESTTEQSAPEISLNVNHYEEEQESLSWLNKNENQTVEEIQKTVQTIVTDNVSGVTESSWQQAQFDTPDTKFKIIKESIQQTGKEVSNRELNSIQTGADLLAHFTKPQEAVSSQPGSVRRFFEDNADELPPNLVFRQ